MIRRLTACAAAVSLLAATPCLAQAGIYTGQWNNTTFGSSGDVEIVVAITGSTVEITADLDGFVFGAVDPDPFTVTGTLNGDGSVDFDALTGDSTFGDVTASLDALGNIDLLATNIPNPGISEVSATGTFLGDTLSLAYTVSDPIGPFANGTLTATLIPEPATAGLLTLGAAAALRRRR